jgi:hypothetical protein
MVVGYRADGLALSFGTEQRYLVFRPTEVAFR